MLAVLVQPVGLQLGNFLLQSGNATTNRTALGFNFVSPGPRVPPPPSRDIVRPAQSG